MVEVWILPQSLDKLNQSIISEEVIGNRKRAHWRIVFEIDRKMTKLFIFKLHVWDINYLNVFVPDELKRRQKELVAAVFETQLGLINFDSMDWNLCELPLCILLYSSKVLCNTLFDCEIVFQIRVDDTRRDLSNYLLKGNILLQWWLEVLHYTWFSYFDSLEINHAQTWVGCKADC